MEAVTRRVCLQGFIGTVLSCGSGSAIAGPALTFNAWRATLRGEAVARGITPATFDQVMAGVEPDTDALSAIKNQPEFKEKTWQYLNRRVSAWRIVTGRQRAQAHADLLARIERDFGVDRYVLLGLWGNESAFGEVATDPRYMRMAIPSLSALAWAEPRRQAYWRRELLNALTIIDRGWSTSSEMVGSWAGAMGHTQWMPEVWLNVGIDYDGDGRISPFGRPDDALAGSARYLVSRGKYRRDEAWGMEVTLPAGMKPPAGTRTIKQWADLGLTAPRGGVLDPAIGSGQLWSPATGGPLLLTGRNFAAVRSYNPSANYALAVLHLGDRIRGVEAFQRPFPGGERILTLEETQELQRRLTALGYNTYYVNGRVGRETLEAIRDFQRRSGLAQDGYPGLVVLAKLRGAS